MRMSASWSGSSWPTEYKVATRGNRVPQRAPLVIVIPTTASVPSCSELSRYGLAMMGARGNVDATANLDSPCARQPSISVGRAKKRPPDRTKKLTKEKKMSLCGEP
jgi:hypothetical protein